MREKSPLCFVISRFYVPRNRSAESTTKVASQNQSVQVLITLNISTHLNDLEQQTFCSDT